MFKLRSAGIITGPQTHLDHLGVLCAILQIPLIVTEEETYVAAKKYYPQIDVALKDYTELSIDYLAAEFDVLFESGKFWAAELVPIFQLLYGKKMRAVFCPHGNSDKGHSLSTHVEQDISLVYGDHMIDLLKKTGAYEKINHVVRTGNYRHSFYLKHKEFYDSCAKEEVFSKFDRARPTILYAPTWQDSENPSSFFNSCKDLIEQFTPSYNLVVKLHPFLEKYHPAQTYHILSKYEAHPKVSFLTQFPPIYPLLDFCDIYLGDFSSIGYDFLAFNKPMYFFNPLKADGNKSQGLFLHRCGMEIPQNENIYKFLKDSLEYNKNHFSTIRNEVYSYAFGKEIDPFQIKEEIEKVFS